MNKIDVLDCTLRDGGYINQWNFGKNNIVKIISGLVDSNIDIIECGYLTNKNSYNPDSTLFDSIQTIEQYLPITKSQSMMVCMINFGEYDIKNLPSCIDTKIDGIRLAFHKKDLEKALEACAGIMEKGYKLFMQPMVSVSYSDQEFIDLINRANLINPYAFYIVDSFGVMKRKELMRLYYLVDHNLNDDIFVGYHSHNNIQMAYSNAQTLVDLKTKRKMIIDSSVFGMGRGAGNLNTELFIEYINEQNDNKYSINPLLKIIDQVLSPIHASSFWGYSLPHYASATNNCHPNYASYLDDKSTLTIENLNEILKEIDDNKRFSFDKSYIENLYLQYQTRLVSSGGEKDYLKSRLQDRTVVMIAPGRTIDEDLHKIDEVISKGDNILISINFKPERIKCDYVFISNLRRYEDLKNENTLKIIKTSNIQCENENGIIVNYSELLNDVEAVEDNAAMMLVKLLIDLGVKRIMIAGLDGYSHDIYDNYVDKELALLKNPSIMDAINVGMEKILNRYAEIIDIEFITKQKYVKLIKNDKF